MMKKILKWENLLLFLVFVFPVIIYFVTSLLNKNLPPFNFYIYFGKCLSIVKQNMGYYGTVFGLFLAMKKYSEDKKKIKKDIISLWITNYYYNIDSLINHIVELEKNKDNITMESIFDEINRVFLNDTWNISDYKIRRLSHRSARDYYKNYMLIAVKKSIKENIARHLFYCEQKLENDDPHLYVWEQFGEVDYSYSTWRYNETHIKLYVDLRGKSKKELVNITIRKQIGRAVQHECRYRSLACISYAVMCL